MDDILQKRLIKNLKKEKETIFMNSVTYEYKETMLIIKKKTIWPKR